MMSKQKVVFHNFSEYWHYAKYCSEQQRNILFNSMSKEEQDRIQKSYKRDKWEDVFNRNKIDNLIDDFKEKYDIDLLDIRYKIFNKKSVYLPKNIWNVITTELGKYESEHTDYVIGNINAEKCEANKDVILLVYNQ